MWDLLLEYFDSLYKISYGFWFGLLKVLLLLETLDPAWTSFLGFFLMGSPEYFFPLAIEFSSICARNVIK